MHFARRRAAIAAATALALSSSLLLAPTASAQTTSTIEDVFMGVGSTNTEALLNWTTRGSGTEFVQILPAAQATGPEFPATTAQQIQATNGALTIEGFRYSMSAKLTGLEANTEYLYRIGSDERGWTKPFTLSTGGYGDNWEFSVFGDPQIGASGDPALDGKNWRAATAAAANHNPDMFVSLGDQVDYFFDSQKQQREYQEFFSADELTRYRTAVNRGNHDAPSKAHGEMFTLPNSTARGLQPYHYWFERNNALFVSLDSNTVGQGQLEQQKQFLRDTVSAHGGDKDWVIVTYHHSTYSQAYHQADSIVQSYRNDGMVDLFSELGVDLVLGGHDHIHTRSHLMVGDTPVVPEGQTGPDDELYPKSTEVLYVTASTSTGSKTYPFASTKGGLYTEHPEITTKEQSDAAGLTSYSTAYWVQDETPDYTQIKVTPEALTLTTYNVADNSIVDKVTLHSTDEVGEQPKGPKPAEGSSYASSNGVTPGSSQDGFFGRILKFLATIGLGGVIKAIDPRLAQSLGINRP